MIAMMVHDDDADCYDDDDDGDVDDDDFFTCKANSSKPTGNAWWMVDDRSAHMRTHDTHRPCAWRAGGKRPTPEHQTVARHAECFLFVLPAVVSHRKYAARDPAAPLPPEVAAAPLPPEVAAAPLPPRALLLAAAALALVRFNDWLRDFGVAKDSSRNDSTQKDCISATPQGN